MADGTLAGVGLIDFLHVENVRIVGVGGVQDARSGVLRRFTKLHNREDVTHRYFAPVVALLLYWAERWRRSRGRVLDLLRLYNGFHII